jgi:hypothetical protein
MSAPINDGGPAFPTVPVNHGHEPTSAGAGTGSGPGMTLRDWFAGQAMVALIMDERKHPSVTVQEVSSAAVEYADAMIQAREAKP